MTLTRHENGAGATPTFGRRRRRADQLRSAAAASAKCRRRRRIALATPDLLQGLSPWISLGNFRPPDWPNPSPREPRRCKIVATPMGSVATLYT